MAIVHHRQTGSGNAEVVFKLETIGGKMPKPSISFVASNSNYLNHDLSVFHL